MTQGILGDSASAAAAALRRMTFEDVFTNNGDGDGELASGSVEFA